jgi:hypothetical protein
MEKENGPPRKSFVDVPTHLRGHEHHPDEEDDTNQPEAEDGIPRRTYIDPLVRRNA